MHMPSILRAATLALSLVAMTGAMSAAFAATSYPASGQQQANAGIYDGPDFVAPLSDTY